MNNLFKHQQAFVEKNPAKHLLCWSTGTGKTRAALEWAQKSQTTLIVVPKALKENWKRECSKHFHHGIPWSVMILTKEEFRRDWCKLPSFESIIFDEAHHFAGMKSQMSKAARSYVKRWKIPRILLLTATPYRSSPWDIYVLAKILGHEWSYPQFADRFFTTRYVGRGRQVPVVRDNIEDDVAELVSKIGETVRLDECADVPEQTFEVESFTLTKEQEKAKKEVYDPNPIVRYTKHHEIENGFLKGDEYQDDQFWVSDKEDRILQLAQENDKIIIVCRYHAQLGLLESELGQLKKPIFIISGKVKNRDEVVQAAEKAEKAIVLIQAACSEGYELPSFPLMVFASLDFSYVNYKQMLGRILRINKLKKNVYLHLVSKGIDTEVFNAIMKKRDFDLSIYARDNDTKTEDEISREGLSDPF